MNRAKDIEQLSHDMVAWLAQTAMSRKIGPMSAMRAVLGAYFITANKMAKTMRDRGEHDRANEFYDKVIVAFTTMADVVRKQLGEAGLMPEATKPEEPIFDGSTAHSPVPEPEVVRAMRRPFFDENGRFDLHAESKAHGLHTFELGGAIGVTVDANTPTGTAAGEIKRASDIVTEAIYKAIGSERIFVQVNGIPAGFFFYMNALASHMVDEYAEAPGALPVRQTIANGLRAYIEAFETDTLVKHKEG